MIKEDTGAVKLSKNEELKVNDPSLAGGIGATLEDPNQDRFANDDTQFLKFHGIYQQDDRDLRKQGKKFMFMVRTRQPGGLTTPDQYLAFDDLADKFADGTLRITSRQGFQFHGILKGGLGPTIQKINEALLTTLAACGDVVRNVMAPPTPSTTAVEDAIQRDAALLSDALLPQCTAYHQIWLEGQQLDLGGQGGEPAVDPLYGKTYLPRKFKVAFAAPPLNDTDIFTNCMGFISIEENGQLIGYNLTAGGGLGMNHGNAATFPRKADVIGFFTPDKIEAVAKGVVGIHRDYGDRTERKHARLKYVLEDRGAEWFRKELENVIGFPLEDARPYEFTRQGDVFDWRKNTNGSWFLGLFVQSGRIKDTGDYRLKSAMRKVVEKFRPEIRQTSAQNLIINNISDQDREAITQIFLDHGVAVENQATLLRRASMACPALPTCGLALAESERVIPDVLGRIENMMSELGLSEEEVVIRMTGCPNGCARPYMAEIGFVGRAPNKYQIYLGGNEASTRVNQLFKENIHNDNIIEELRPVFERYKAERQPGERFGDFCFRAYFESDSSIAAKQ